MSFAQMVSDAQDTKSAKEILVDYFQSQVDYARTKKSADKLRLLAMQAQRMNSKAELEKFAWNCYLKTSSNPYDAY